MISVQVICAFLLLLYCLINRCLGSADDDFYKKFHQKDYNLKFTRETVTFCNKSIIDYNHTLSKYNRTQFVTNVSMVLQIDVGNDLEVILQAYKFLSNEYRIFPLRFEYNICKALKQDLAGLQSCINACGNMVCPMKKNIRYYICNCIHDESKFPPFMPSGDFKLTQEGIYKNQLLATAESYVTISRKVKPERKYLG